MTVQKIIPCICSADDYEEMSLDDLLYACDVLCYECDACDEDYCYLRCPLAEKGTDHEKKSCLGYVSMTNADRIRAMTDEELADFLCDISGGESCTYCVASDLCHNGHNGMIEWLKEEVKGDTDEDKS